MVNEVVDLALVEAQSDPSVMKGFKSFVSWQENQPAE